MCDRCYKTLKGLVKPHAVTLCPLAGALYCGVCAVYGHSPAGCPDAVTRAFRSPQYLEQLIPPSALEEYHITSRTPLSYVPPVVPLQIPPMRVPETTEAVRAALISIDVKPKICQVQNAAEELKANKLRLEGAVAELGREVQFVNPAEVLPPYADPPIRRFKLRKKTL